MTLDLKPENHRALRVLAALEGRSMKDIIEGWIEEKIAQQKNARAT